MKTRILFIVLFACCTVFTVADNQKGYVKTKGRLGRNGTVIAGSRLSDVTIKVKNRTAILSKQDGTFSFPIAEKNFALDSVLKKGYVLSDPDVLYKTYSFSKNPLVLVLENMEVQKSERRSLEQQLRKRYEKEIAKRETEIEQLKSENKISEERYIELIQRLNEERENNEKTAEKVISYLMMHDYDKESAMFRTLGDLVLNGELEKADSIINSEGSLSEQIMRHHEKGKLIKQIKESYENETNTLAEKCYFKYLIALQRHQNDSAYYCLDERAKLDTTNIRWLLDAGEFAFEYSADYATAQGYFDKALEESSKQKNAYFEAESYNDIANNYHLQGKYKEALAYYEKAIALMQQVKGSECWEVAKYYGNIGTINALQKDLQKGLEYNKKALDIYLTSTDEKIKDLDKARGYNNVGESEIELGHYQEGEGFLKKGLEIAKKLSDNDRIILFELYNNLGNYHFIMRKLNLAGEMFDSARVVAETLFGTNHPKTATIMMNLGVLNTNIGNFEKGYENILKSVNIYQSLLGDNNPTVMAGYSSLAVLCGDYLKQYDKELVYAQKAADIAGKLYEPSSLGMARAYHALAGAYRNQKDYEKSLLYNEKVAAITREVGQGQEELLGHSLNAIGTIYAQRKDYEKAIDYFEQSMRVFNIMKERGGKESMEHVAKSIKKTLDKAIEEKCAKKALRKRVEELQKIYPDSFTQSE